MRFPQVEVVPGARQVGQPRSFNAGCNEIIFEKFCPHYYSFPFSRRKSSWWWDPIAFGVLLRTPPPLSTAAPHGLSHIAHKNLVGVEAAIYSCSSDRARVQAFPATSFIDSLFSASSISAVIQGAVEFHLSEIDPERLGLWDRGEELEVGVG